MPTALQRRPFPAMQSGWPHYLSSRRDQCYPWSIVRSSPGEVSSFAEPRINYTRRTKTNDNSTTSTSTQSNQTTSNIPSDERGDLLVKNVWATGTDCIIDVRMTDTDSPSYLNDTPADVIENQEKQKKRKYVNSCLKQRRTFTPFVLSVDGLLGKEAKSFLKAISTHLSSKWDQPYSVVRGYVNAKLSIAALRASHQCIRGSRTPSTRICRDRWYEKPWDDGAGLHLFKTH